MTTAEHINAIAARCRADLALAEKRTPGRWTHRQGEYCSHWISRSDNLSNIAEIPTASNYTAPEVSQNAAYIAACAGAAEAGWRSTIAAIEGLKVAADRKNGSDFATFACDDAIAAIIAAWPEELL